MDINNDIAILLAKYFSGEASAKELSMLDDWLAESEINQAYFDEMTLVYEKSGRLTPAHKIDTNKAWEKFDGYMRQSLKPENKITQKPINRIRKYISVAAAIAALAALTITLLLYTENENSPIRITSNETMLEHVMPDSSLIMLSENSSITYGRDYGSDNKIISLTGKASLIVPDKSSGNLTICVDETFIKDIGTAFTIDGYEVNDFISVSVESGVVQFYTANDSGLRLYENEAGYFNKSSKQFTKRVAGRMVDIDQIVFDATPLYKVIERLHQQFSIPITISNDSIAYKQLTVTFSKDESVVQLLQIVAETLRLNIQLQNGAYVLSPR